MVLRTIDETQVLAVMRHAGAFISKDRQVFGVTPSGLEWHPYSDWRFSKLSPIGAVLLYLGLDPWHIEAESEAHSGEDCPEGDPDCVICWDNDTSIYIEWVQEELAKGPRGVEFTPYARDLLWEAETSGLPLYKWLETR